MTVDAHKREETELKTPLFSAASWRRLYVQEPLWIGLCVAVIFGATLAVEPFPTSDRAFFEYVGLAMSHGQRLYLDVWDTKLPSIFLVNEAYQVLFGQHYFFHIVAQAAVNALSVLLFAVVLRQSRIQAWAPAAFAFSIVISLKCYFNTCEQYALPCTLLAYVLAFKRSHIASGIALAFATTFWIPAFLLAIPLLLRSADAGARLRLASSFGLTLCAYAAVMWAAFGGGTVTELTRSWFVYAHYSRVELETGLRARLGVISLIYGSSIISGVAMLCALLILVLRKPRNPDESFALWWVGCALAAAAATGQFFPHYFLAAVPALIFAVATYGFQWGIVRARMIVAFVAAVLLWKCALGAILGIKEATNDTANAQIAAERIERALGPGAVIYSQAYAPEMYLASAASLPNRFAIDEPVPNLKPFITSHHELAVRQPAVILSRVAANERPPIPDGTRACGHSFGGWQIYVSTLLISRFSCGS